VKVDTDITKLTKLEVEAIRKNPKKTDWTSLSYFKILPEKFIREFQDYVNWIGVSRYQKLSKKFKLEFKDKLKS